MSYLNIYKASFENLTEGLKKQLEYLDKSEVEDMQSRFHSYLKHSASKHKIDLAKQIDWSIILCIFNNEVKKLVDKFEVPKHIEDSNEMISHFRYELLRNLRHNIFNLIEIILNDIDDNISAEQINKNISESVNNILPSYFRVFDMQFQLTSLNPNNNPSSIMIDVERTKKYKNHIDKLVGGHNIPEEIKAFNKIRKLFKENNDKGIRKSFRNLAFKIAKEDLGIDHIKDQKNFYNRFDRWNRKTK